VPLWTAPKSDHIPVEKTRLGVSDIDYDGREDLVVFNGRGDRTRIRILKSRDAGVVRGPDWLTAIAWNDIRPY
jgi:hypothetical protein